MRKVKKDTESQKVYVYTTTVTLDKIKRIKL